MSYVIGSSTSLLTRFTVKLIWPITITETYSLLTNQLRSKAKMKTRQSEQAFRGFRDSLRTQKMLRTKFPTIWTCSSLNFDYVVVFSRSLLKYDLFHVFTISQNFTCSAFSPTGYFRSVKRTYSDLIMSLSIHKSLKQEQITALQRLRFRFFNPIACL